MDNIGSFIEDLNKIDNYDAMDATIDFITWKLKESKSPLMLHYLLKNIANIWNIIIINLMKILLILLLIDLMKYTIKIEEAKYNLLYFTS